jgi:hypothetical protein
MSRSHSVKHVPELHSDSKVDSAKPNYSAKVLRLILRLSKKYVLTL